MMSRTILAEYDAEHKTLKLEEPLEGVEDREKVNVAVEPKVSEDAERPWMRLEGSWNEETGREIATAIREAFGRDQIEV